MEQAEDAKIFGEVGASLVGKVSLGSDVKFLFWKKNILDLELYSKTLGEASASPDEFLQHFGKKKKELN